MRKASGRADRLSIFRQRAATYPALHVDEFSDQWNALKAQSRDFPSLAGGTLYVGVWRVLNDDEQEADARDMGHKEGCG